MNQNKLTYLDGFSGYGGFRLGFERAGWKFDKVYFSEIDKYAIANYKYNFPDSEYVGSITDVRDIGKIDLFTFRWPCQDNSIAGKRKGQSDGTRSGLLFHAISCLERFKPRHFVAENVKGLQSVNGGIDIIESLKLLSYLNDSCPQYDIEMQLLNTRWFLPQNRERLFFVGHLRTDGSSTKKIFPIGETAGIHKEEHGKNLIANCLDSTYHKGWLDHGQRTHIIASFQGRHDHSIVVHNLQPRNGKGNGGKGYLSKEDGTVYCLDSQNNQAIAMRGRNGKQEIEASKGDFINTLTSVQKDNLIIGDANKIRRLTPTECGRLQGLPDGWLRHGLFDGIVKEISDTQQYRMAGNGVSIPVVQAIAEKLKQ